MEVQPLLIELCGAGLSDAEIARRMEEVASVCVAPSIVQRLRVGKHKRTSWERTNGIVKLHTLVMKTEPKAKPIRGMDLLEAEEIDKQIAHDFLALRKEKRLPLTPTAFAAIKREAEKAGFPLEEVLRICCEEGWGTFKLAWYERAQQGHVITRPAKFSGIAYVLRNLKRA